MCVQHAFGVDAALHNVRANDGRIHGIRVFAPCSLGHRLPWMAGMNFGRESEIIGKTEIEKAFNHDVYTNKYQRDYKRAIIINL